MKCFLVVDCEAGAWFDQFQGETFKEALGNSLKDDPELLGFSPEDCRDKGVEAIWDNEDEDWEFARGHFDKYVDMIYDSYKGREEVIVFDITDSLNVQQIDQ